LYTYKHGGDAVGKRVGDDGEAGRGESGSAERLDYANQKAYDGEWKPIRAAVHKPTYTQRTVLYAYLWVVATATGCMYACIKSEK